MSSSVYNEILTLLLHAESLLVQNAKMISDTEPNQMNSIHTELKEVASQFCLNHSVSFSFLLDQSSSIEAKITELRKIILKVQRLGGEVSNSATGLIVGQRYEVIKPYRKDHVILIPAGEILEFINVTLTSRDGDYCFSFLCVKSGDTIELNFSYNERFAWKDFLKKT